MHTGARFRAKTCIDSQVHPLKLRITAGPRSFPSKTLQRFPSLPPEIKNRSSSKPVLQAKPFFSAATKIRIGRGPRSRYDRSRRNHSLLPQRKLESDAEDRCRHGSYRRNHSSLRQRKLESDSEHRAATTVAGGTILTSDFRLYSLIINCLPDTSQPIARFSCRFPWQEIPFQSMKE